MFWKRLASGIVLLCIAALSFVLGGPVLAAVLMVISLLAYLELTKAVKVHTGKKLNGLEIVGILGVIGYYCSICFSENPLYHLLVPVAVFMVSLILYVIKFPGYQISQVMASVFSFVYAPVMLSFVYLTRQAEHGSYIVWLILISSWGCDTCAYVVGMLIGRKKIFPVLSPKKSLEGCIGGVAGSALIGALYGYFIVSRAVGDQKVIWVLALICAIGAVISQCGDLAASAIKRQNDIKDYGKLIPGHGGIMDRFDSVIVTAPMIYFLMLFLM